MGSTETIIVFAALMAVIALVAIALDWVGRPMKNRRFMPRMYRHEDEIGAPPPALRTPTMGPTLAPARAQGTPAQPPLAQPPLAQPPAQPKALAPNQATDHQAGPPLPAPPSASAPSEAASARASAPAASAFASQSGGLAPSDGADPGIAQSTTAASTPAWAPGMRLDERVNDTSPTVEEKAARFWKQTAADSPVPSHFDDVNLARMRDGNAPTRRNPLKAETEAMELVGLRGATHASDVRLQWPDADVDPWSPR